MENRGETEGGFDARRVSPSFVASVVLLATLVTGFGLAHTVHIVGFVLTVIFLAYFARHLSFATAACAGPSPTCGSECGTLPPAMGCPASPSCRPPTTRRW